MSMQIEHISTIATLVRRIFGADIRLVEGQATIGVTISRIAINNPRRVQLHVVNNGTTNVYYSFSGSGQVPTIGVSDFIPPGGYITWLAIEDGETVGYELLGISNTAGQVLDVQEYMAV